MKVDIDRLHDEFNRLRVRSIGTIRNQGDKLKPNQKCPCGSGKKYKKCCQQRLEDTARRRGSNTIKEADFKSAAGGVTGIQGSR